MAREQSPGLQTPKQRRSEQTLLKVLDACDQLLADRAFEQISMQDIARGAGVSVGNLYNRFKDRDALIVHIIQRHQRDFHEYFSQALADNRPDLALFDRVQILARTFEQGLTNLRPVFATLVSRAAQGPKTHPQMRSATDDITQAGVDWLLHSSGEVRGDKAARCRFAVASLAFGFQYDLLLGTATRLFGGDYGNQAALQAYYYLIHEGTTP